MAKVSSVEHDMSDSAWLAIKTKTDTQKSEPTTETTSVEPLQKDVDNLLVIVSFSLDEETKAIPIQRQPSM